jgi:hypothetical protein
MRVKGSFGHGTLASSSREKVVFLAPLQLECREDDSLFLAGPAISLDIASERAEQHDSYTVGFADMKMAMRGDSCWLLTPQSPRNTYSPLVLKIHAQHQA